MPTGPVVPDSEAVAEAAEIELRSTEVVAVDSKTRNEVRKIEQDQKVVVALERDRLINRGMEQDIAARKEYANRIFRLIVGWLIAIFSVLILHGFLSRNDVTFSFRFFHWIWPSPVVSLSKLHFELSDPVLLALIGGTTASVLGLFVIVANYLFPKK